MPKVGKRKLFVWVVRIWREIENGKLYEIVIQLLKTDEARLARKQGRACCFRHTPVLLPKLYVLGTYIKKRRLYILNWYVHTCEVYVFAWRPIVIWLLPMDSLVMQAPITDEDERTNTIPAGGWRRKLCWRACWRRFKDESRRSTNRCTSSSKTRGVC